MAQTNPVDVMITGAGGFIGAALVRQAARLPGGGGAGGGRAGGVRVVAVVRGHARAREMSQGAWGAWGDRVVVESADVGDAARLAAVLDRWRPQVVINAAAYGVYPQQTDEALLFAVNVAAVVTLHRLARERGVRRFLHLGSCSEYGASSVPLREDAPVRPLTAYGATKAAASVLLQQQAEAAAPGAMETCVLRLFNQWGPGEGPNRLVPAVLAACRTRVPLPMTLGEQVKDYSFVFDTAAWIMGIALLPGVLGHAVVNVASGQPTTLRDFAVQVVGAVGASGDVLQFGALPYRAGDALMCVAETTRLDALLPSRGITALSEALGEVLAAAGHGGELSPPSPPRG